MAREDRLHVRVEASRWRDGAGFGGSTSMVTHKVICTVTVESIAPFLSTRWILITIGSVN